MYINFKYQKLSDSKMLFRSILLAALLVAVRGEQRIAGGVVADITKYPFAAALLTNGGSGDFVQECGGSIISNTAILSAASCFHSNGELHNALWWRARVGSSSSIASGFIHLINRITVNPNFNQITNVHDLAVLRPSVALAWRDGVQPAPIAGMAYTLSNQQSVQAIGWGRTWVAGSNSPLLREVDIFVVDQTICAERYSDLDFAVTEDMVCAGFLDVGVRGQCQGDKGSPLVVDGVVVGVKSRSESCPDPTYPAINMKVASYTRWIVSAAIAD
ncbi:trypsin, alkaline B-like [Hyposmocoma kahamanoa]|uniref:trypsin, alkaline B-like n=1 Tax=Hyposmocoma kahamanoa TaxID=1477025 RepID=UPI000E6D6103|nr:trypsin, alkaline B-like [Hyposmocoma kahamanoa]